MENDAELKNLFLTLQNLRMKLKELDETVGNDVEKYNEIFALVNQLNVSYSKNNIINVNLRNNFNAPYLNQKDIHKIKAATKVFSLFSEDVMNSKTDSNLVKFKNAFYKRYEEKGNSAYISFRQRSGNWLYSVY